MAESLAMTPASRSWSRICHNAKQVCVARGMGAERMGITISLAALRTPVIVPPALQRKGAMSFKTIMSQQPSFMAV